MNSERKDATRRDYYVENGCVIFTAEYLLSRGQCCDNGCRHCPYEKEKSSADTFIDPRVTGPATELQ